MTTTTHASAARQPYVRDSFTWLAYFMLAYFACVQAALGPAMPFLRAELGLNFSVAGLHISAMAVGMIAGGLTGAALVRRLGRPVMFVAGGGGMALGGILLVIGQIPAVTIGGALVMGLFGTYLLNLIPATLSDHHGPNRATAVTEANVLASLGATLAPALIGLFASTAIGWRGAFWVMALAWVLASLLTRHIRLPAPVHQTGGSHAAGPLPRVFWLVLVIIVLVVSAEWSVVAWSAEFLDGPVGLDTALASGLMSAYFAAMIAGRFIGSRLTTRLTSAQILPGALALAFGGFLLFWLAPAAPLNVAGLFVAGLGVANLFPQSLAWATTLAGTQTDRASSLVSLACGLAILVPPQILGAAADLFGIARAMGLVGVLLVAALAAVLVARQAAVDKAGLARDS